MLFNKTQVYMRQPLYTENFGYMSGQAILLAFEAILGHRSAHSLATGPVMALPARTRSKIYVPYLPKLG